MSNGKILVVDDEATARSALADVLRGEGYSVETAADGFKALGRLADFEPELVLTDLHMPGMDGVELLKKLKEHDAELPVILMTAFGGVETAVSAMREGAADYLTKPLNLDELSIVVARTIESVPKESSGFSAVGHAGRISLETCPVAALVGEGCKSGPVKEFSKRSKRHWLVSLPSWAN